jgi:small-conductance mechanosensitive channel
MQRSIDEARAAKRAAKPIDVQVREAERIVTKCRKAVATTQDEASAAQQAAAAAVDAAAAASGLAETARAQLQSAEAVRAALLLQRSAAAAPGAADAAGASEALARLAALIPAAEALNPAALADLASVRLLLAGLGSAPADDAESDAGTDTASLAMDLDDSAIDRIAALFRPPPPDAVVGQAAAPVIDDDQRFELVRLHARSKRKELATAMQALRPAAVRKRITK